MLCQSCGWLGGRWRCFCHNREVYLPAAFAVDNDDVDRMLLEMTAGDLVTSTDDGLTATFLPMVWVSDGGPRGSLIGHMATLNDHWRVGANREALVIAHGPDAYISPSWYASKAEHGRVVPTWNYVVIHVHGNLVVHEDPEWTRAAVTLLTDRHEGHRTRPWRVDEAPQRFLAGQLRAIVGVEVPIEHVEAKVKMSQNRPPGDIDGIIAGLTAEGDYEAAAMVAELRNDPE